MTCCTKHKHTNTHTHPEILSNLEQNLSTAVVYFLRETSSISASQKPVNGVLQMSMCSGVGHQCSSRELSVLSPATPVRQSRRSKGTLQNQCLKAKGAEGSKSMNFLILTCESQRKIVFCIVWESPYCLFMYLKPMQIKCTHNLATIAAIDKVI